MNAILRFSLLTLCLAAIVSPTRAADQPAAPADDKMSAPPTHLKFSDPTKPGKIRLKLMWGDVTVTAADTQEVTILSNIKNKQATEKRSDGLRRLDSEVTYSAAEKENVITIELGGDLPGPTPAGASVALTVPRSTSFIIESSFGGSIAIKQLAGDVEIRNMNGEITLEQLSGAALVETMNGEIHATFAKVAEGRPLSFTSMNGEIDVRIPADTKANVRLRTQNGAVLTDFDEKALVTKTEPARGHIRVARHTGSKDDWQGDVREAVREATRIGLEAAREAVEAAREAAHAAREGAAEARGVTVPPIPPVPPVPMVMPSFSGGKVVTGTLNGGGSEIQISTMNGTITLRKTQP
jgi:ribosomal protein S18